MRDGNRTKVLVHSRNGRLSRPVAAGPASGPHPGRDHELSTSAALPAGGRTGQRSRSCRGRPPGAGMEPAVQRRRGIRGHRRPAARRPDRRSPPCGGLTGAWLPGYAVICRTASRHQPACPHPLRRSHGGLYGTEVASPEGTYAAMVRLESLPDEEQPLRDADVSSWQLGQEKPAHHTLYNTKKEGCLSGGSGGCSSASSSPCSARRPAPRAKRPLGSYQDIGISDVRDKITPGTSALFIFASDHAALDRAADEFRDTDAEIIRTACRRSTKPGCARHSSRTRAQPRCGRVPRPDPRLTPSP
jgi:hypothetical protein